MVHMNTGDLEAEPLKAWRRFVHLAPFSIALLLAIAGCPPSAPPVESAKPAAPSGAAPTGSAAVTTAPVNSASAAPSAGPAPERERPPRTGIAGSTRGTIACGSARCTPPGEVCTWDEPSFAWVCRAAAQVTPDYGVARYACDDGFDCPDGETCCQPFDYPSRGTTTCVRRAEVSSTCSAEICMQGGAKCPGRSTCTAQSPAEEGACAFEKGPATCEGKKLCPGDKPICIMNKSKKLECTTMGSDAFNAVPSTHRWQCTRNEDCHGGESCSYAFGEVDHDLETYCANYSPPFAGTQVCDPTGPSPCGKDAECLKTYQCSRNPDGPKWMGAWGMK
jgi:hypothetical protein